MVDFLWFLVVSLAVWRVSNMFINEDGPLDIFYGIRLRLERFFERYNKGGSRSVMKAISCFLYSLFSCVWCMSVWIGFGFAWLVSYSVNVRSYIIVALAMSAIACVLEKVTRNAPR